MKTLTPRELIHEEIHNIITSGAEFVPFDSGDDDGEGEWRINDDMLQDTISKLTELVMPKGGCPNCGGYLYTSADKTYKACLNDNCDYLIDLK